MVGSPFLIVFICLPWSSDGIHKRFKNLKKHINEISFDNVLNSLGFTYQWIDDGKLLQ